ncbi:MAG: reverse transcriptase/maturase family protein [bacterium]|nr:reverse transcriptase/maturase family protein [bacterium]
MKKQFTLSYKELISLENLLEAWREFLVGKQSRTDTQEYALALMQNIQALNQDLSSSSYRHGGYRAFTISDPKPRDIHKASVRDRLLHHAIHRKLYPFFQDVFVADSYSCQRKKGVHRALKRFASFGNTVSQNNTRTCWILKCDIKKFFANVHHDILQEILRAYIPDKDILALLDNVLLSFNAGRPGVGLPLGNLTSQLFVNMYLNALDAFVKHRLKATFYIRYCDDFVIFSYDRSLLEAYLAEIHDYLLTSLQLELHPRKVSIDTLASGVDFLGWVHYPRHRILRTTTKRRMFKRIDESPRSEVLSSYLGLLQHGTTIKLKRDLLKKYSIARENRFLPP